MKKSTWYRDLLVMLAALCVAGVAVVWVQRITGRIDGVASVSVSGGVERQITVTLDAQRAAGYGLSTSYITQILQAENLLYPAGEVYNGSQKLSVTTDAQLSTVDEVANINIPLQTGGTVRLGEVADVAFETSNRDAIAAMDGTPGIILQVSKRSGANEVKTAEAVVAAMEELAAKAIEESNGKTFYGVGNSSRGKSALPLFIEYRRSWCGCSCAAAARP